MYSIRAREVFLCKLTKGALLQFDVGKLIRFILLETSRQFFNIIDKQMPSTRRNENEERKMFQTFIKRRY